MIPPLILLPWALGLLSIGIIAGTAYLFHEWQERSWGWDPMLLRSVFEPHIGWNNETALLACAIVLAGLCVAGRLFLRIGLSLFRGKGPRGNEDPWTSRPALSKRTLKRPDGSALLVSSYGVPDGTPIILTHGWGFYGEEWNYLKRDLAEKFLVVVWDEPGLGRSTRPTNRDYSLENLARDLHAVLETVGNRSAILLGHSIGGMIALTFCRLFPAEIASRVVGLVLTHTTPQNPVRTVIGAKFFTAIEKPVLVPLMYLTIALSPLLWLTNWLSYLNGSMHLTTKLTSFAGTETWTQIEFSTWFQAVASPAVLARGMLGMMRYDAREVLRKISIPVLVVAGDRDIVTKPEASEHLRSEIPDALLVTLSPASHLGLIEHHAKYGSVVREFSESLTGSARV